VQDVVEEALRRIGWQDRVILAAGRTDTGVHASGQVIAIDLDWQHSPADLQRAINANLPADVAAREVHQADADFHPRYRAASRSYRYHIFCQAVRDPLRERYAWRVWPAVDPQRLEQAAGLMTGRYDFAAFGTPPHSGGSTVRTVLKAGWHTEGSLLVFEITAQAFLYHMVRRLVAAQVEIGQGHLDVEAISRYLQGQVPGPYQGLAPSQGLILAEVCYQHPKAE